MRKYLDLFVAEAQEHIQGASHEMSRLATGRNPAECLNALFRHFHSIKGMAASMGFQEIGHLSHAGEDLFERLRQGADLPREEVSDVVMEMLDALVVMVAEAAQRGPGAPLSHDARALLERARALAPASGASPAPTAAPAGGRVLQCVIGIDPGADMPAARAMVLRRLEEVGTIVGTSPPRERFSEPGFDGEMLVHLATDRPQADVLAAAAGVPDLKVFELAETTVRDARRAARAAEAPPPAIPESGGSVRVSTSALDRFLDAISEMVTCRAALAEAVRALPSAPAQAALDDLTSSIHRLREQVMALRLIPFEHITPRLTRAVRELCRATGRRAALHIGGADVALDRSVLEEMLDPLLHILRNAVDHGIRPPEERAAAGKPANGSIRLELTRVGDGVRIVVEDDGEGMDADAIRQAAQERGFRTPEQLSELDDEAVLMLTTIPGFSTARQVTEVSGRGVGMDIVRTRVEAMRGHMSIRSRRGVGTRIELRLPLTVAILDAFLVESKAGVFAVPAACVLGVQIVERDQLRRGARAAVMCAGSGPEAPAPSPLVDLDEALQAGGEPDTRPAQFQVLSFHSERARGALAVDRVLGRQDVVVRPLGPPLERLRRYSGAALLDNGRLALVLDLTNLLLN